MAAFFACCPAPMIDPAIPGQSMLAGGEGLQGGQGFAPASFGQGDFRLQ